MILQACDRLSVALHARLRALIIKRGWARHEFEPTRGDCIGGRVDVIAPDRDVLDPLTLVLPQILLDLALVVGAFVDGDADLAAGGGQRAAAETGELALDVEKTDLAELEGLGVEPVPGVHVAAPHVV